MMPSAYAAMGHMVLSLPACLLLAGVGMALSLRKDRLYALLTVAAALWFVQTGIEAVTGGLFTYAQMTGTMLPTWADYWGPSMSVGLQTALQTVSWVAIAVALLWPRLSRDLDEEAALAEDAVA